MKRLSISAVAVMTSFLIAGTSAMAAGSPSSTATSVTSNKSGIQTTAVTENWIPRGHSFQAVNQVRFTSAYKEADKDVLATAYAASKKELATTVLQNYVDAAAPAAQKFGPYKIRMYRKGVSIWDGFGTFKFSIGVGSKYNGKTATIYQIHKDGSITTTSAVVTGGKVDVSVMDMGTFYVVL